MSDRLAPLQDFLKKQEPSIGQRGWWCFPSKKNPRFLISTRSDFWQGGLRFVNSKKRRIVVIFLLRLYWIIGKKADLAVQSEFPEVLKMVGDHKVEDLAIYVSTSNRFSKYTLLLLGESGEALAFAKLAEAPDSLEAIQAEANALKNLTLLFPKSQSFPRLLHQEHGLTLQSPVSGSGYGHLAENAGRIAAELFETDCSITHWAKSRTREKILKFNAEIYAAGRKDISEKLSRMDELLESQGGSIPFREGLTHGDYVSWNMIDSREGFVFDWEWTGNRPEFYDQLHFLWFAMLGKASQSSLECLINVGKLPAARALMQASKNAPLAIHGALYLVTAYAFYCYHSVVNNEDPMKLGFVRALHQNFYAISELDFRDSCFLTS